jgi:hypothetical protein
VCLGAASQRIEALALYLGGHLLDLPFLLDILAEWKRKERGAFPGIFECFVIIYIVGELSFLQKNFRMVNKMDWVCCPVLTIPRGPFPYITSPRRPFPRIHISQKI